MTPDELKARAERTASALIAEHGLASGAVRYDLLVSLIALGWSVGWGDGFAQALDEAKALTERALHAVQS